MKPPTLVCPHNRLLLDQIGGHDIVVRVRDLPDIPRAAEDVRCSGKALHSVIIETRQPLSDVCLPDGWAGIPIALFVPGMGNFRDVALEIGRIRDLKIHVYLPAGDRENLTSCRVLASLGVTCCLVFDTTEPDWEALSDLMTWAVFAPSSHAPVEPFHHVAVHHNPGAYVDWGVVYFDGPGAFLHLDWAGRVALSHRELQNGSFIAEHVSLLGDPFENEGYRNALNAWRHYFLGDHPCIACEGWKICMGRFGMNGRHAPGCRAFASDMLAEIEQYKGRQQEVQAERSPS